MYDNIKGEFIMKNDKYNNYEQNEKEDLEYILNACDEISSLTEEQYQNERKFFTSFDEELERLAKNLSKKIKNGEIKNDVSQ